MIDVFKVGVHIGMTTNASQVLSLMLRELTGINLAAGKLEKSLGTIRTAALAAGAVFAGWKVVDGLWHAIEHNRELNKELEKTKQLGGEYAANISQTRAQAVKTQGEAPTTTLSNNVRLAREIGMTLGHPDAVNSMLTMAAKGAYVVSHATGEDQETVMKNLIRSADSRGHIFKMGADGKEHVDPSMLQEEMNAAVKGLILGQGFINSGGVLQMARMAGLAGRGQSSDVFYSTGIESAIMLGASKTGVAETGLIQQFIGGTMTKKVAEHLTEAGLIHRDEWTSGNSGGVVLKSQVAQRMGGVQADPQAYFSTGAGAEAIKTYADKNHITNMMAILQLFGRQTTQRLVADFMGNNPQFDRARSIFGGIRSIDSQYKELQANDLDTNIIQVTAAWKSFMEAFSDAGVPLVIPILHGLTDGIHALMLGVAEHPEAARLLIGLAGGIASLVALSGSIKLFSIAIGPFIDGIKLLVGLGPGISKVGAGLSAVSLGLSDLVAPVAAIMGILKLGSDAETPANRSALDALSRARRGLDGGPNGATHDGFGPDGRPETIQPAPGKQSMNDAIYVHVANAGDIGRGMIGSLSDGASRPSSGPSYPDYRYDLPQPGLGAVG